MNAVIEGLNAWGARFAGFALPMLLQSAVLITLLFALDLALRKRVRATLRYAVWMLVPVKLALPPSLASPTGATYWLPAETTARYSMLARAPAAGPEHVVIRSPYKPISTVRRVAALESDSPGLTWRADCFVVWLAVALGMGTLGSLAVSSGVRRAPAKRRNHGGSASLVGVVPATVRNQKEDLGALRRHWQSRDLRSFAAGHSDSSSAGGKFARGGDAFGVAA